MHIPRRECILCCVTWVKIRSVHMLSGWANPNLCVATAAFYSPWTSDISLFALSSHRVQTPTEPETRVDTCKQRSDWIFEVVKSSAASSAEVESSGPTKGDAPTDLSAAGHVEVDEIAAALPCGQVQKAFICESTAVGQTQVLKAQTAPVRYTKRLKTNYVSVSFA